MTTPDLSNIDWPELLTELRRRGLAVAAFTPQEIGEIDADHVEEVMCEAGGAFIADHRNSDDNDDNEVTP